MKITLLAYRNAPASIYESGLERLKQLLGPDRIDVVEKSPDVLYFLSGGSERAAIDCMAPEAFVCLIGSQRNNAMASAVEVMAYLRNRGIPALLLDEDDPRTPERLIDLHLAVEGLRRMRGKKLGLIGEVSEWLVASTISPDVLKKVLGIELEHIRWEDVSPYSEKNTDAGVLSAFTSADSDLSDTARVASLLRTVIKERSLDALTVECFSLVKKNGVTACLPLALFNAEGIPAGCEGDIASAAGMMLGKEVTGTVPWMANLNKIDIRSCLFSHCTVAPALVTASEITSHFETGLGTSVRGKFSADAVTVFRLKNDLTRAFISEGPVTGRPCYSDACRTQIEVRLPAGGVRNLKENPFGNHHLIFPGSVADKLETACRVLGIQADVCR